ncbi:Os05g0324500 [Oryza sativa Japonica Group]|uniref:Os05g0324500 protein n=1 Tax=Oryza sativa subsp. japonica TaxID=39947 RepID=A0A0P0WKW8_ORYSJ|nr:Os05g0324500 [Oryza sativa Japonica Group]
MPSAARLWTTEAGSSGTRSAAGLELGRTARFGPEILPRCLVLVVGGDIPGEGRWSVALGEGEEELAWIFHLLSN